MDRNIECFIIGTGKNFINTGDINKYGIKEYNKTLYADLKERQLVLDTKGNIISYTFKLMNEDNEIINLKDKDVETRNFYVDLYDLVDEDPFTKFIKSEIYGFNNTESILNCVFGMEYFLKDKWRLDVYTFLTKDCPIDRPYVIVDIEIYDKSFDKETNLILITHDKNENVYRNDYFDRPAHIEKEKNKMQYFIKL